MPRGNGTDKKTTKEIQINRSSSTFASQSETPKGGTEIAAALDCNCLSLSREKSARALICGITN